MRHLVYTLVFTAFVSALAYYTLGHSGRQRAERLEAERVELEQRNDALRLENQTLERNVVALRDDPRLAERRAREIAGLSRPDELIFTFKKTEAPEVVSVRLSVGAEALKLAGRDVAPSELGGALSRLRKDVPGATLTVEFAEGIDALERQRVRDVVESSPLAPASYVELGAR